MYTLPRKSFYFMRHAQTDWNCQKRVIGHIDQGINACGKQEALAVRPFLCKLPIKKIWYSPLKRCVETMHLACNCLMVPKKPLESLKEWNRKSLEGRLIKGSLFTEMHSFQPGDETQTQFFERVLKGMNHALKEDELSLFIAHTGIYYTLCYFTGIVYQDIANCGVVLFTPVLDMQWQITRITS
jgi:uncharacterized phosphatase